MLDVPYWGSTSALLARAAALEALADRIDAEAGRLGSLVDPVVGRLGADVWRGPAATQFAERVRSGRARLDSEAGVLNGVASRLRARAQALREEARRIAEAEAAAAREREAERRAGVPG